MSNISFIHHIQSWYNIFFMPYYIELYDDGNIWCVESVVIIG